jgi:UDP-N-acetylglucosamine--N-acetylmuramyl-(pentapeptide) pyrophosphoryl-undecaprenol N-acetylglucosamine transferase
VKSLVIAGGGTGGHISPAISVAESVSRLDNGVPVHFVCTPRPVDRRMYSGYGDEYVHVLDSPRLDRGGLAGKLVFPFRAIRVFAQARSLLRELDPKMVFATGGYSSFFTIAAARWLGIPAVLHDSNSIPGRSNRMASRFADSVMLGFRSALRFFPKKGVHTGNPVRDSLERIQKAEARKILGMGDGNTVLFLGGSQGAAAVNDLAIEMSRRGLGVILQSGERDFDRVRELGSTLENFHHVAFVDDPSPLYSAADVCVARSGAMTIAELCWFRLPAVFVPYPYAADDHQTANASEIVDAGGALCFDEAELTAELLYEELTSLTGNPGRLQEMAGNLGRYMPGNPSGRIAEILLEIGTERGAG